MHEHNDSSVGQQQQNADRQSLDQVPVYGLHGITRWGYRAVVK